MVAFQEVVTAFSSASPAGVKERPGEHTADPVHDDPVDVDMAVVSSHNNAKAPAGSGASFTRLEARA
jgi:hypothetical protein